MSEEIYQQMKELRELIIANIKHQTTMSSPNRNKSQKKVRARQGCGSSSSSEKDSRWADQCDTDAQKPCDKEDTSMEIGSVEADH
jgi:hypothetical protein